MSESTDLQSVQFVPFTSFVDPTFWTCLTDRKLNVYQLDESEQPFIAHYSNSDSLGIPCRMRLDYNSFDVKNPSSNLVRCNGRLRLMNKIDDFTKIDKKALLNELGSKIWSDISSGEIFENLSSLCPVYLLSFVDIKKFNYYFWFAYPAIVWPIDIVSRFKPKKLTDVYSLDQVCILQSLCTNFPKHNNGCGYFLIKILTESNSFEITTLDKLKDTSFDCTEYILGFFDPSADLNRPGWPLRNLFALWGYYRKWENVRVLSYRQHYQDGQVDCYDSFLMDVTFKKENDAPCKTDSMKVYGWEKNDTGHSGPKFIDFSSSMDPAKIAENAVGLNLQLMRWRLVPELNLNIFKEVSCLLVGSGTLGCNIARALLGWGVKKITFIDNGKVSYSNPVRQSLFTFADCLNGGKPKAETAAESLEKISPTVMSSSVSLTVPMPGHVVPSTEESNVKRSVDALELLISTHDVIFLLVDTREGRWLPTMLSTLHSKLTFSVALGFDSFLAIRHGYGRDTRCHSPLPLTSKQIDGEQLGCYFCSDVTAPSNSTADRTLDQQCTVTRPGVSMIAAGHAVELMASVLQHPLKGSAPAEIGEQSSHSSCLGCTPHQIRGFLGRLDQITPAVQRFDKCTACSNTVLDEYTRNGFAFLLSVFNDPSTLERLTGLDELQNFSENANILEFSDDESVKSMDC